MTEANDFLDGKDKRSSIHAVNEIADHYGWDIEDAAECFLDFLAEVGMGEQISEKIAQEAATMVDAFELVEEFETFAQQRAQDQLDPDEDED